MGLDGVEILMNIEKAFNISIEDEEAQEIETVSDLYDCVLRKINRADIKKCLENKEMINEEQKSWTDSQVFKIVQQIISDQIATPVDEITGNARLVDDLGIS